MSAATQPMETAQTPENLRATTNRQNAEHSTGPRTPEGKERVRFNALKHGMYSKTALLPGEDVEAYQSLCDTLAAQFPTTSKEGRRLVHLLGETQWRINRLVALDTNLHALGLLENLETTDPNHDPDTRACLAQITGYRANAGVFNQLFRHEKQLRQLLDQTRIALEEGIIMERTIARAQQAARSQSATESTQQAREQSAQQASQQPTQSAGGFVPSARPGAIPGMPHFTGPMADLKRKQWLRKNGHAVPR